MEPATELATDATTRALALAAAARLFRSTGHHTSADTTYRRALAVLRDADVPSDHDAHRSVRQAYAAFLVELGRDRDAAALELDIAMPKSSTPKETTS